MKYAGFRCRSNAVRLASSCSITGIAAALILSATATLVGMTAANAKPEFAAQTGMPCGQCHQNPAGGGKLKAFGEKFKANGNKVPK